MQWLFLVHYHVATMASTLKENSCKDPSSTCSRLRVRTGIFILLPQKSAGTTVREVRAKSTQVVQPSKDANSYNWL